MILRIVYLNTCLNLLYYYTLNFVVTAVCCLYVSTLPCKPYENNVNTRTLTNYLLFIYTFNIIVQICRFLYVCVAPWLYIHIQAHLCTHRDSCKQNNWDLHWTCHAKRIKNSSIVCVTISAAKCSSTNKNNNNRVILQKKKTTKKLKENTPLTKFNECTRT